MTNERAIELLKRISDSQFDGEYGNERREALEMAVRALSGDGDTIYRQEAIDLLKKLRKDGDMIPWEGKNVFKAIRELPSAQPVNYGATKSDSSSQLKLNNDLISRKQVLNASHFVACWDGVEHFSLEVVDADFIQKLPSVQPTQTNADSTHENTLDCVSRQAVIDAVNKLVEWYKEKWHESRPTSESVIDVLNDLPSAQPERLTDDDFETIRIHLNAYKEKLCNQQRWEEAEEYQRIIDRFMAFASAQPETHDKRTETHACDLINRQQAIDAVKDLPNCRNGFSDTYDKACIIGVLEDLPTAQTQWIPCSERLPKVFNVLCCDVNGDIIIAYPSKDDDSDTGFSAESESEYMPNVVAWMPLPKPYGGESDV